MDAKSTSRLVLELKDTVNKLKEVCNFTFLLIVCGRNPGDSCNWINCSRVFWASFLSQNPL